LTFSSEKSLAAANSEDIKVLQLDATFSPIPAKKHSGLYQLLVVHVVTFGPAIPVLHMPMTNKKEWLYTRVLEWLQNKCPNLSLEKFICDFKIGLINACETADDEEQI
jgi:hypothetical protein